MGIDKRISPLQSHCLRMRLVSSARIEVAEAAPYFLSTLLQDNIICLLLDTAPDRTTTFSPTTSSHGE